MEIAAPSFMRWFVARISAIAFQRYKTKRYLLFGDCNHDSEALGMENCLAHFDTLDDLELSPYLYSGLTYEEWCHHGADACRYYRCNMYAVGFLDFYVFDLMEKRMIDARTLCEIKGIYFHQTRPSRTRVFPMEN